MFKFTAPKLKFGRVPNGRIVVIHFRVKTSKFDWAIYEELVRIREEQ